MHFDHAGGTSRFPKARFIVQRRELEYAAGALPHNSAARGAFVADDVLALVQLNWQGRVLLVDGDAESVVPGVDVYLTPGSRGGDGSPATNATRRAMTWSGAPSKGRASPLPPCQRPSVTGFDTASSLSLEGELP
jgi:hypothetical protein